MRGREIDARLQTLARLKKTYARFSVGAAGQAINFLKKRAKCRATLPIFRKNSRNSKIILKNLAPVAPEPFRGFDKPYEFFDSLHFARQGLVGSGIPVENNYFGFSRESRLKKEIKGEWIHTNVFETRQPFVGPEVYHSPL